MIDPIASVASANQAEQIPSSTPAAALAPLTQKSTPGQWTPADTVLITGYVKDAITEALEVPWQTFREASNGDLQAQRLLAREAAARKG
jgi:hypothetical protein